ncbi:hypothetical protein D3C76_1095630 [compost metagenome]
MDVVSVTFPAPQHFGEEQGDCTAKAVATDQQFLPGIELFEVFNYKVIHVLRRFVEATVYLSHTFLKRHLKRIGISKAVGDHFIGTAHSDQDQFFVMGDERLAIGIDLFTAVIKKVDISRVLLVSFQFR